MDPPSDPLRTGIVIVALSGGVDSAVAALLLVRAGYRVQGLYMANWDEDDAYCTAALDYQDARRVCDVLGIPLHRASFARQYRERVFAHFLREYAAGRTPNPDVLCNREIKFGVALEYMRRLGAARIATGHYARLQQAGAGVRLLKGRDPYKDQSYFLHGVEPAALERTLFPLGELHKREVRRLAHAAGLPVHDKPDSTGICFIGERPFREFLGRHLDTQPGPIETAGGTQIGEHRGLALYTLGQREGLGIGGRAGAAAAPWYVAAKDTRRNTLVVVQEPDHPLLMSRHVEVEDVRWLAPAAGGAATGSAAAGGAATGSAAAEGSAIGPAGEALGAFDCSVKTRYRQPDLRCRVRELGGGRLAVTLAEPARAVTPGQYAVFYRGDLCLGGGVIARSTPMQAQAVPYNPVFSLEES